MIRPPRNSPPSPTRRSSDLIPAIRSLGALYASSPANASFVTKVSVPGAVAMGSSRKFRHDRRYASHPHLCPLPEGEEEKLAVLDRKSTRLNSSHSQISYAVF